MFETITDADERGQVGIGTLIVFIAMVLVAAIAAGVLINTAGSLQSQASNTGSETQQAVANQIEVVHAVGERNDGQQLSTNGDNAVERLNLTVKKSAGSDAIDLTSLTVQYTSDDTDKTLTHIDYTDADPDGLGEDLTNLDGDTFTTIGVGDYADNSMTNTEERVTVVVNAKAIEGDTAGDGLGEGESATIKLVDQSGAQFSYGVSVPATFGDKYVVNV